MLPRPIFLVLVLQDQKISLEAEAKNFLVIVTLVGGRRTLVTMVPQFFTVIVGSINTDFLFYIRRQCLLCHFLTQSNITELW